MKRGSWNGGIFITGTDTSCGKTLVCGLLGHYLAEKGSRVVTQKWVQTGTGKFSPDIDKHNALMLLKKEAFKNHLSLRCPYNFKLPASPHLAAAAEGKVIQSSKIKKSFRALSAEFDLVLVEGTGGALVPFSRKRFLIDIAQELDLAVLIVAANRLGAINHALLTIEAVKARGMKILGIIFNNCRKPARARAEILKDNPRIVKDITGISVLGVLPYSKDIDYLHKAFFSIGQNLFNLVG